MRCVSADLGVLSSRDRRCRFLIADWSLGYCSWHRPERNVTTAKMLDTASPIHGSSVQGAPWERRLIQGQGDLEASAPRRKREF